MSNTNNAFEYEAPVTETELEVLPETADETPVAEPKKKNVAARIFGAIFAALCVGVFFLPLYVCKEGVFEKTALYTLIIDMINGGAPNKMFGVLPTYANASAVGTFSALAFYGLLVTLVLSFILGIVTIFCSKKAPGMLRATVFLFATGFTAYAVHALVASYDGAFLLDIVSVAAAGVGLLTYFVLSAIKVGKKAWVSLLQLVLTLGAAFVAAFSLTNDAVTFELTLANWNINNFELIFYIALGVLALNCFIGAIRVSTKKGLALDMIRYIVNLLLGGVICYIELAEGGMSNNDFMIYAIVAAAVPLVQIILCIIQIAVSKPKKVAEAPVEETPVEEEYVREEYAEALPYEGGPVEGVELAQEAAIAPVVVEEAPKPEVKTAGYDFYNSKAFDPFIAMLSNEERNQFTELFILKYQGAMPEIPDYVVGGDNKEFFRKVFIYLGQYRDKIPDGLLAKIYQFAVRM